jgi:hypothetical protein
MEAGKQQVSANGGYEPVWNPSGMELFYRRGDEMMAVPVQTDGDLILGRPAVLFEGRFVYPPLRELRRYPGRPSLRPHRRERSGAPPVLIQNFSEVLKRLVSPN